MFEDNNSFVWFEVRSVARSRRLRAIDSVEGRAKLLLYAKTVYNCFVMHLHFFKIFISLTYENSFHSRSSSWESGRRHCFLLLYCDVKMTWFVELMKIRSSVNSSIAANGSMNCWPLNSTVMQQILGLWRTWLGYLLYVFWISRVFDISFFKSVLRSAKRAPANVRRLNNRKWRQIYCSVSKRSRALGLLNAALFFYSLLRRVYV